MLAPTGKTEKHQHLLQNEHIVVQPAIGHMMASPESTVLDFENLSVQKLAKQIIHADPLIITLCRNPEIK